MKVKVVKKGSVQGKPNSFCAWIVDDWKAPTK